MYKQDDENERLLTDERGDKMSMDMDMDTETKQKLGNLEMFMVFYTEASEFHGSCHKRGKKSLRVFT